MFNFKIVIVGLVLVSSLSACVPLIVGGATGTAVVVTDRRSAKTQLDDKSIETQSNRDISRAKLDKSNRISVTSFNHKILLVGVVKEEQNKIDVENIIAQNAKVKGIVNQLVVTPSNSSLGSVSKDTWITTKVKSSLIAAKDINSGSIKVITDQKVVYLMGMVSEREAKRAAEIARGVNSVIRVVQVFDILTETELSNL